MDIVIHLQTNKEEAGSGCMKLNNVLVIYSDSRTSEHKNTIKAVKAAMKKNRIRAAFVKKEKKNKSLKGKFDLVVSIGGDGTFIESSQLIRDKTLILGVNSDPLHSEGAHTSATRKDFEAKMKKIIEGDFSVEKWTRLEVTIDHKKSSVLSLNEIYIGAAQLYNTSRYWLFVNRIWEEQKSSGVIFSTGCGSTAWYSSAGGRPFSKTSKEGRFIVREPYCGHLVCGRTINGIIKEGDSVHIRSNMRDGMIAIDSAAVYPFPKNKEASIRVSDKPLHVIVFD